MTLNQYESTRFTQDKNVNLNNKIDMNKEKIMAFLQQMYPALAAVIVGSLIVMKLVKKGRR